MIIDWASKNNVTSSWIRGIPVYTVYKEDGNVTGWSISLNTGKYHEIGQAVSLSRIKEMFRYSDKDNTNILDDKAYKEFLKRANNGTEPTDFFNYGYQVGTLLDLDWLPEKNGEALYIIDKDAELLTANYLVSQSPGAKDSGKIVTQYYLKGLLSDMAKLKDAAGNPIYDGSTQSVTKGVTASRFISTLAQYFKFYSYEWDLNRK